MNNHSLKASPRIIVPDGSICIFRYVSGISTSKNSSLSFHQPPIGRGALAGALITGYHSESNGSAPFADSKPGKPSKAALRQAQAARATGTRGEGLAGEDWPKKCQAYHCSPKASPSTGKTRQNTGLAYLCHFGRNSEPRIGIADPFVDTRRQAKPVTSVAFVLTEQRATH